MIQPEGEAILDLNAYSKTSHSQPYVQPIRRKVVVGNNVDENINALSPVALMLRGQFDHSLQGGSSASLVNSIIAYHRYIVVGTKSVLSLKDAQGR